MIISKIQHGLGNQLFQYAFGRYLSLRLDTTLKLDISWFSSNEGFRSFVLDKFNIKAEIASSEDLRLVRFPQDGRIIKLKQILKRGFKLAYYKQDLTLFDLSAKQLSDNVYLDGMFMSEAYFKEYREQIKLELTPKSDLVSSFNQDLLNELKSENSVAVHVRRGDFVKGSWAGHYALSSDYYKRAMKEIRKEIKSPQFYFFSDDINWVKENFSGLDYHFVDTTSSGMEDFSIMVHANSIICANSTFSWWAAYLRDDGNCCIIVPERFLMNSKINYQSLYPDHWKKL